jgi:hypothetical protein
MRGSRAGENVHRVPSVNALSSRLESGRFVRVRTVRFHRGKIARSNRLRIVHHVVTTIVRSSHRAIVPSAREGSAGSSRPASGRFDPRVAAAGRRPIVLLHRKVEAIGHQVPRAVSVASAMADSVEVREPRAATSARTAAAVVRVTVSSAAARVGQAAARVGQVAVRAEAAAARGGRAVGPAGLAATVLVAAVDLAA